MKTSIVIFAGAFLAYAGGSGSAATPKKMDCAKHTCCRPSQEKAQATADPGAEERFRMKFGRSTPAGEVRQKAAQEVYAKNMRNCAEDGCGSMAHEKTVSSAATPATADPGAEERFRMKFGRNTSAEERRQTAKSENPARTRTGSADRSMCGPDCCKHDR